MKSAKEKKYRKKARQKVFMVEDSNLNSGERVNANQIEKKKNQCVIVKTILSL